MKLLNYSLVVLLLVSACKEDEKEDTPVFSADYGSGMYIVTENGISFYNDQDSFPQVKNQIFKTVNNTTIVNPKKIKFRETKAYIVADHQIVIVNIETFGNKEIIDGFTNAVDFDFVSHDRLFVVDKGDSKVKAVDLLTLDITSDIETGDNTQPVFIVSKWYRSIVMNGGRVADSLRDSTIVAIDYRDELESFADFNGSIYVGDNPNSAVWINDLKILCKGIYDPNNSSNNTEASLVKVNAWDMQVIWTRNLSNIFNAQNLISDDTDAKYFFTAIDGVYQMNNDGSNVILLTDLPVSDVLFLTAAKPNILYINDAANNPNTIYGYNINTSVFSDTIVVDGNVRDIAFYE